jgi:hypothetical protein
VREEEKAKGEEKNKLARSFQKNVFTNACDFREERNERGREREKGSDVTLKDRPVLLLHNDRETSGCY